MSFSGRLVLTAALAALCFCSWTPTCSAQDFVLMQVASSRGRLEIAATPEGWGYARLAGTQAWVGPVALRALDPLVGTIDSTVGTNICATRPMPLPLGGTTLAVVPFSLSATGSTLSSAAAKVHLQVAALQNAGWTVVPCPGGGGDGST